jgi:hypothetical protein
MTISEINQVHGIRVSRLELYEWIYNHKNHEWYNIIVNIIKDYEGSIDVFIKYVRDYKTKKLELENVDNPDYTYYDLYNDIHLFNFSLSPYKDNKESFYEINEEFKIELHDLTHDTDSDDFIFGIVVCKTKIFAPLKHTIDPESDKILSPLSDEMCIYNYNIDAFMNNEFVKDMNKEIKMFMVQDDCICCS